MLKIGQLARLVGLEAKTLRYYDRIGLVRPAARTPAGYRLYDERAVDRIRFILRAKSLGIPLSDIRDILVARDHTPAPSADVLKLLKSSLATLESRIAEFKILRPELQRILRMVEQAARRRDKRRH